MPNNQRDREQAASPIPQDQDDELEMADDDEDFEDDELDDEDEAGENEDVEEAGRGGEG